MYKTSERFVGWQIKGGINFTYLDVQNLQNQFNITEYSTAVDLIVSADYALPINFDKQLIAGLSYSNSLNDEVYRLSKLKAAAQFAIDHSYNWASTFYANYSVAFMNDKTFLGGYPRQRVKMNLGNLIIGARTDFVLLDSFSFYASLEYKNLEFLEIPSLQWSPITERAYKEESIMFHLGFNIYIL